MADSFCDVSNHDVDDDIHRWLPSEILRDIGIAVSPCEGHCAIIEDLAAHLADVLFGSDVQRTTTQHHVPIGPPPAMTNKYQSYNAPPTMEVRPFICNGGMMLDWAPITPQRLAPEMRMPLLLVATSALALPPPPTKQSDASGTGFFLPHTEAYTNRTSMAPRATKTPHHVKRQQWLSKQQWRRQEEEEASMMMRNNMRSW
uniref:Uncharacterized protein n=1 Tax=Oryza punctata TaxID=4537 RepID=A0A0E0K5K6_ORYPU